MSTSIEPQQQPPPPPPPPMEVTHQSYNASQSGHGSIGPVIGVLAVITILGAIAVMIGRLCSGRRIMGHGQYDFEGWVEAKCGSCIDGRVDPPPRPRPPPPPPPPPRQPRSPAESGSNSGRRSSSGDAVPEAGQTESCQEAREEEITQPDPNEAGTSAAS